MKLDQLREELREDDQVCMCCKLTTTELRDHWASGDRCMSCRKACRADDDGTYVHAVERNRIEVVTECPKCGERKRFAIARGDKVRVRCKCGCESEHDVERVRVPLPLPPQDDEDDDDDFVVKARR